MDINGRLSSFEEEKKMLSSKNVNIYYWPHLIALQYNRGDFIFSYDDPDYNIAFVDMIKCKETDVAIKRFKNYNGSYLLAEITSIKGGRVKLRAIAWADEIHLSSDELDVLIDPYYISSVIIKKQNNPVNYDKRFENKENFGGKIYFSNLGFNDYPGMAKKHDKVVIWNKLKNSLLNRFVNWLKSKRKK